MYGISYYPLITAGCIFALVAFMHLMRVIFRFSLIIADRIVPLWVNLLAFILAFGLSFWMFYTVNGLG